MRTLFVQLLILIVSSYKTVAYLTFPGTKWCGNADLAQSYDDLGIAIDTDKCCRQHDHCKNVIPAGATGYNLTNTSRYPRFHCSCDDEFYRCLRMIQSFVSNTVGYIYFNVLGTQCFREDYPIVRCLRRGNLPRRQCQQYEYDTTKDMINQWFDMKDF